MLFRSCRYQEVSSTAQERAKDIRREGYTACLAKEDERRLSLLLAKDQSPSSTGQNSTEDSTTRLRHALEAGLAGSLLLNHRRGPKGTLSGRILVPWTSREHKDGICSENERTGSKWKLLRDSDR